MKTAAINFYQVEFKTVQELQGKRGPVVKTFGLSEYDFNRGLRFINVYTDRPKSFRPPIINN